jgi:hypothetical protein
LVGELWIQDLRAGKNLRLRRELRLHRLLLQLGRQVGSVRAAGVPHCVRVLLLEVVCTEGVVPFVPGVFGKERLFSCWY